MSKRRVSMWVHPKFRSALQKKKADSNIGDMISFTERMAEDIDALFFPSHKKSKKGKDDFKFL